MRVGIPQKLEIELDATYAATQSIVFAGFLWWFTWFHFVIKFFYGLPVLSRPNLALVYYEQVPGYPFSLAQAFLGLSVFASVLALGGVWMTSLKGQAKWRQRFLVFLFGTICTGFSCACVSWEQLHVEDAKEWRQFLMDHPYPGYDDAPYEVRSKRWKHLDDMLERAEQRKN
ncbi:MAG: hypothetical protein H7A51_10940 [Akkermansiaceae bacterium]|nr:hypothetical protein [Akkermansiaceae bacterium]